MLVKRSHEELLKSRDLLYAHCNLMPDKRFLLTEVGCGIAGYEVEYMKGFFTNPPENLILPDAWLNSTTS